MSLIKNETTQGDSAIKSCVPFRQINLKDTVWRPNEDSYKLNLQNHKKHRLTNFHS